MTIEFTPTKAYLPQYYSHCEDMTAICNALDDLYFRPFYTDVCLKSQIYGLFRNDLATAETIDAVYEDVLNRKLGISGEWANRNGELGKAFPEDWPKRRICAWLLMTQLVSHPSYTMKKIKQFITNIERLFHFYDKDVPWISVEPNPAWNEAAWDEVQLNAVYHISDVLDGSKFYAGVVSDIRTLISRIVPSNIHVIVNVL